MSAEEIIKDNMAKMSKAEHNNLVKKIATGGFKIPQLEKEEGIITGHVYIKETKPDNNAYDCRIFPVAYISNERIYLVNKDQPALEQYHDKLKKIVFGK
ncbi:MAG: hypothetical protein WC781_02295 [Candidatus Pacearchaeota archaeon]|jgi:hypothetical protein